MRLYSMRLVCAVLSVSLVACSSLQPVQNWRANVGNSSSESSSVRVGDEVRISTLDGTVSSMVLTAIEMDALTGRLLEGDQLKRIPVDQISAVERKGFDGWKTTGLAAIVLAAFLAWALSHLAVMTGG